MKLQQKGVHQMKKNALIFLVLCFAMITTASAAEFSADMVTEVMGMKTNGKVYFKNYKTQRTETDMMGMKMVQIVNYPKSYQIFMDTRKYVVSDVEEMKQQNPMTGVDSLEEFVKNNDFKKVGTETVEGYQCDIYEGNVVLAEDQPALPMKLWYSSKLDYAVKTEVTMPAPMSGKVVSVAKNIKTGKQPNALFEIPSGFSEAKNTQEAMGMGGFGMPAGGDSDEMPSREDMQKMMESMKDMMNQGREQ